MLKSKKVVTSVAALIAIQVFTVAHASPMTVGQLNIKTVSAPLFEKQELASANSQQKRKDTDIGKLTIADEIISSVVRNKTIKDSNEVVRTKTQLAEVIEAANDFNYDKAITIMKHLHIEHPESRIIQKWLGIYQNWAGQYDDSLSAMEEIRNSHPLDKEKRDFMTQYYIVDNKRHLGLSTESSFSELTKLADKEQHAHLGGIDNKDLAKVLTAYQKFMINSNNGQTGFTHTDSKILDSLWNQIPREKQCHLDNFFGYNIDELSPIYGSFYNRKDILNEYDKRQQKRSQHTSVSEIKKTEQAQPATTAITAEADTIQKNPTGN